MILGGNVVSLALFPPILKTVAGFAAALNIIALLVWRAGLKRYESGNLINVRS